MYNLQFICTYSFYDPELREKFHSEDNINLDDVKDFEELSDIIYQADLLRALGFTEVDFTSNIEFNEAQILEIYNQLKNHADFLSCIEKAKNKHLCEDLEAGFVFLLSYDYFFLTHKCLCEYLTSGNISDANIDTLNKALE